MREREETNLSTKVVERYNLSNYNLELYNSFSEVLFLHARAQNIDKVY